MLLIYWQRNEAHITRTHERINMKVSRITTRNNQQKMIEAMVASDYCVSQACRIAGIYPSTHYRWLKKDEKYVSDSKLAFEREEKRQDRIFKRWEDKFYADWFKMIEDIKR